MKELVKGSGALTLVSMGEVAVRLVRTKFIALILGPMGLGFIAQLFNFFETLRIFGDLGARQAVGRQIAETLQHGGRESEAYKDVISSSLAIALSASSLTALTAVLFSAQLSRLLFGDAGHGSFIVAASLLLPLASVSTVIGSIIKGNLDFSSFAKYTLGAYGGLVLVTPFLLYGFHLSGAVALLGLFFLFPLIGYLIMNLKDPFLRFSKKLHAHIIRYQFEDGSLQVYLSVLAQLTRLGVGVWIIKTLGFELMGVFQMALAFSTVYLSIPLQAMSGYVFPAIAAASDTEEVNRMVNDSFRFSFFLFLPVLILLMVFPEIFIKLLFSEKFYAGANVLRILLYYSLSVIFYSSFTTALVAKRKLKVVYGVTAIHTLLFFLLMGIFSSWWQLPGISAAFSVSAVFAAWAFFAIARHRLGIFFFPKNVRLLILSGIWLLAASAAGFLNAAWPWRAGALAFMIPWFFMTTKAHERKFFAATGLALWRKKYGDR